MARSGEAGAAPAGGAAAQAAGSCSQRATSILESSTGKVWYPYHNFGNYNVQLDDWGPDPGTVTQWINSASCWGCSTTTSSDIKAVSAYPNVSRGWTNNGGPMQKLSTSGFPGAPNWTTLSGMGIQVSALKKCRARWTISTPATPNTDNQVSRWNALMDVYLHNVANPSYTSWPPQVDLQIMQRVMDQPVFHQAAHKSSYHALVLSVANAWLKTFGGVQYVGLIGTGSFNQPGGHTITMFARPTMFTDSGSTGLLWGQDSLVHDVGGILSWLAQPSPLDDGGKPILHSNGAPVTAPVIPPSLYLTVINAGFEIDFGTPPNDNRFVTRDFWVAMQDEPDGS